ncbi:MAG TPA: SGNH/GDSL hydrolase family protein [Ornithinibacter sp.]|jgi:lysophospholipase L1-like esterase|nr:SGNH/GDSL hydrolase family protein [Ornithinibacter sp.]
MARRRALVTAAFAAVTALVISAAPAGAAAPSYVALGDSYSSGTGTRSYLADGTSCLRSVYAYPSLIASAKGYALNFRACSGAKISDVTNSQLSALTASTSYVTLSVGGNDAGFADVLTTCAQPAWLSNCNGAVDRAQAYIRTTLPAALTTLYASIRARAPQAKVTVVGYPRIFNGEDCNLLTWFSPTEESRLNATADLLNSTTAARASAAGYSFANPTSRFVGHAVCDSPEWINGLSNPVTESYHPNKTGQASGYTPAVSPFVTGATVTATAALLTTASASSDRLARQQRAYAVADRRIAPEVVLTPDLTTPRARVAAARAGVDLGSRASIDAADRLWAARQAAEFASR